VYVIIVVAGWHICKHEAGGMGDGAENLKPSHCGLISDALLVIAVAVRM
jgi:hypothetical protein